MFIYSSLLVKVENIKSVKDILVILRNQGVYDLPVEEKYKYTPDINVLAKSIYELIQRGSPEVKALIGEVLTLIPQTEDAKKIIIIWKQMTRMMEQTMSQELLDRRFQLHVLVLANYCDAMIVCSNKKKYKAVL